MHVAAASNSWHTQRWHSSMPVTMGCGAVEGRTGKVAHRLDVPVRPTLSLVALVTARPRARGHRLGHRRRHDAKRLFNVVDKTRGIVGVARGIAKGGGRDRQRRRRRRGAVAGSSGGTSKNRVTWYTQSSSRTPSASTRQRGQTSASESRSQAEEGTPMGDPPGDRRRVRAPPEAVVLRSWMPALSSSVGSGEQVPVLGNLRKRENGVRSLGPGVVEDKAGGRRMRNRHSYAATSVPEV